MSDFSPYTGITDDDTELSALWGLRLVYYIDATGKPRMAWKFDGELIREYEVLGCLESLKVDLINSFRDME